VPVRGFSQRAKNPSQGANTPACQPEAGGGGGDTGGDPGGGGDAVPPLLLLQAAAPASSPNTIMILERNLPKITPEIVLIRIDT
jgi:hypothetical protein